MDGESALRVEHTFPPSLARSCAFVRTDAQRAGFPAWKPRKAVSFPGFARCAFERVGRLDSAISRKANQAERRCGLAWLAIMLMRTRSAELAAWVLSMILAR